MGFGATRTLTEVRAREVSVERVAQLYAERVNAASLMLDSRYRHGTSGPQVEPMRTRVVDRVLGRWRSGRSRRNRLQRILSDVNGAGLGQWGFPTIAEKFEFLLTRGGDVVLFGDAADLMGAAIACEFLHLNGWTTDLDEAEMIQWGRAENRDRAWLFAHLSDGLGRHPEASEQPAPWHERAP